MANGLNTYFVQSVEELTRDFEENVGGNEPCLMPSADSFCIEEVNETEVIQIIQKFSNSKSNDIYNMNCCFLKQYSRVLAKPLTHLVNLSIRNCKFPSSWKKAVIVPIFKSGSQDSMCNYRPISILPTLSKVMEKVVAIQLTGGQPAPPPTAVWF